MVLSRLRANQFNQLGYRLHMLIYAYMPMPMPMLTHLQSALVVFELARQQHNNKCTTPTVGLSIFLLASE